MRSASQDCTQTQTQYTQDSQWTQQTIIAKPSNPWGRIIIQRLRPKVTGFERERGRISCNLNDYTYDGDFSVHDLFAEHWKVGRIETADLQITKNELPESELPKLSKIQFIVHRDLSHPLNPPILEDCSSNGTFVQQSRVGKGHRRVLLNGDYISILSRNFVLFRFTDLRLNYMLELPPEIAPNYYVGPKLGSGGCGEVTKVFNVRSCTPYALKVVKKCQFSDVEAKQAHANNPTRILNEIEILRKLNHPCVIGMHEIIDRPEAVYMFLELMNGGDLCNRITSQANKRLPESVSKLYFLQTCYAVKYLHSNKITHRDLKPDNILLNTHEMITLVKVTDFGLSKFVKKNSIMKTMCGTPQYVAPEVLNNRVRAYTKKVDIWSLGVMLYTCLCGDFPFKKRNNKRHIDLTSRRFRELSAAVQLLISDCLKIKVEERPTIDALLKYRWLQDHLTIRTAEELMTAYEETPRTPRSDSLEDLDATSASHTTITVTTSRVPRPSTDRDELPDEPFMEPPAKRIRIDIH
ncbi:Ovarian-specific serine/threonine-protein kinase Lok [Sergentomyia squamirostris]